MPKWSRDRRFGGKVYRYFGGLAIDTKAEAKRIAKRYREKGYSVRVIPFTTELGKKRYGIWVR